jgi:hypothetical protein
MKDIDIHVSGRIVCNLSKHVSQLSTSCPIEAFLIDNVTSAHVLAFDLRNGF